MRVVHLSTFERAGGAAIAASRLHLGLRQLGHDSVLLVRDRTTGDEVAATCSAGEACESLTDPALHLSLHGLFTRARRTSDRLFSTDLPTRDLRRHPAVRAADVVNIHWASDFVSTATARLLQDLGKPLVWTLHDQAVFTGGCHYSGSCDRYTQGCAECPQLDSAVAHVPSLVLRHKRQWLDAAALHVICPSEWLAACARKSALLASAPIHTIANSVPVDAFQHTSRSDARLALGLPADATILLVAADRVDEERKGAAHALHAIEALAREQASGGSFAPILCAVLGSGDFEAHLPIVRLGRRTGDPDLALAYCAADLYLLPTLEDNLPNTLLESIAAGTPVVAYRTGGVPDLLEPGGCGLIVPCGDADALAAATATLLRDPARREDMGRRAEAFARRELDLPVQAAAYLRVYESCAAAARPARRAQPLQDAARQIRDSEAMLLRDVLAAPDASTWIVRDLANQIQEHQAVIASRGGEIRDLRASLDNVRQRLHEAVRGSNPRGSDRGDVASGFSRTLDETIARLMAERAALEQGWRRVMTRIVIYGAGDTGRRVWEAVVRHGAADVVAIVDDDPRRQGRRFLGTVVEPPAWMASHAWDMIAVAGGGSAEIDALVARAGSRVVVFPTDSGDAALEEVAARCCPDPLAAILARHAGPRSDSISIGIFGTGAAAMKVWEALTGLDAADVMWFADNDARRHGQRYLWLPVIAPADIPSMSADAVVVGSMAQAPICSQLQTLGIDRDRILVPDVASPVERIRDQLATAVQERLSRVAVP